MLQRKLVTSQSLAYASTIVTIPLTLPSLIAAGIYEGVVRELISSTDACFNDLKYDDTILTTAIRHGRVSMADLLLGCPNINIKHPNASGLTPLALASKLGHSEIVQKLLWHDPDNINVNDPGSCGMTPLKAAAYGGQCTVVKGYLSTPLWIAASEGHKDIVCSLIEAGADITTRDDKNLSTPLWITVQKGHYNIARILLKLGAEPSVTDREGTSLLHLCTEQNNLEFAKLLLKMHQQDPNISNREHRMPLGNAIFNRNSDMSKLLLDFGANVNLLTSLFRWESPVPPLSWAARLNILSVVRELLDRNAEVNWTNAGGLTALHWAALNHDVDTAVLLLERGARKDIKLAWGESLLDWVRSSGRSEYLVNLLGGGADMRKMHTRIGWFIPILSLVDSLTRLLQNIGSYFRR